MSEPLFDAILRHVEKRYWSWLLWGLMGAIINLPLFLIEVVVFALRDTYLRWAHEWRSEFVGYVECFTYSAWKKKNRTLARKPTSDP